MESVHLGRMVRGGKDRAMCPTMAEEYGNRGNMMVSGDYDRRGR